MQTHRPSCRSQTKGWFGSGGEGTVHAPRFLGHIIGRLGVVVLQRLGPRVCLAFPDSDPPYPCCTSLWASSVGSSVWLSTGLGQGQVQQECGGVLTPVLPFPEVTTLLKHVLAHIVCIALSCFSLSMGSYTFPCGSPCPLPPPS